MLLISISYLLPPAFLSWPPNITDPKELLFEEPKSMEVYVVLVLGVSAISSFLSILVSPTSDRERNDLFRQVLVSCRNEVLRGTELLASVILSLKAWRRLDYRWSIVLICRRITSWLVLRSILGDQSTILRKMNALTVSLEDETFCSKVLFIRENALTDSEILLSTKPLIYSGLKSLNEAPNNLSFLSQLQSLSWPSNFNIKISCIGQIEKHTIEPLYDLVMQVQAYSNSNSNYGFFDFSF